jgi:hypothetical protein
MVDRRISLSPIVRGDARDILWDWGDGGARCRLEILSRSTEYFSAREEGEQVSVDDVEEKLLVHCG